MNIIICIDDNYGISFNNRRQSRDVVLCDRILAITKPNKLWMNEYSAKLFPTKSICVDNCFIEKARDNDFCFAENLDYTNYLNDIKKVIIYKWNRAYPSDLKVDLSLLSNKKLVSTTDFKGNSHECITEEIYE